MMYSGDEDYGDEITSEIEDLYCGVPGCPNCGSITGTPMYYDHGIEWETGYHDVGEGCTECMSVFDEDDPLPMPDERPL